MKKFFMFLLAVLFVYNVADARKVSGKVISGEEKLSGVIVTDGKNFTQTKPNGKFAFEIEDDAEFVYIVTPSGYAADWSSGVPAFYQLAEGQDKFMFDLKKLAPADYNYNIIAIGDPQAKDAEQFAIFAGEPLADLTATAQSLKGFTVGITMGDNCWDRHKVLEMWKKDIVKTGIPVYPVIGNHDHDGAAVGDDEGSAVYRSIMGPENYAFWLGSDIMIALDNIIYDAKRKYQEGYADHVLNFVKGLMRYVPAGADVYVSQHSPIMGRVAPERKKIINTNDLLSLLSGHKVTVLSGHNHIQEYFDHGNDVTEHNLASICGAHWDTYYCKDGTPRGYKVFTKDHGKLTWYYKSVGKDKDYQMEFYNPGQAPMHPNSIVANIWDWNPGWKTVWYEDGVCMGELEQVSDMSPEFIRMLNAKYAGTGKEPSRYKTAQPSNHYFAATPSQYAKKVMISVENQFGKQWSYTFDMSDYIDVQAHRGGAGLMPENTIVAMQHCLDMGVNTLEMDFVLTGDGRLIASHDSYFHPNYAIRPDGTLVQKDDPKTYLYQMTYDEILKWDVGSRPCAAYPEKNCMPAVKPLASELIEFVENYTKENGLSPVRYNIEVKTDHKLGDGIVRPTYDKIAYEVCKFLSKYNLGDRLVIQCFDVKALNYMYERFPEYKYSYLVGKNTKYDFEGYMKLLNFTPAWLSPHFALVDEELVKKCHEKGIKLVPYTADKPEDIQRLIDLKVDAIITNYPDRLLNKTRGFVYPTPVVPVYNK